MADLKHCIRCGRRAVRLRRAKGRTTPYRTMPWLLIPETLELPQCSHCHYLIVFDDEATMRALHESFLASLRVRVKVATSALSEVRSLRQIELLLGLSQGYLSKLRSGTSNPSPELTLLLGLLASNPRQMFQRADEFWALPDVVCLPLAMQSRP